MFDKRWLARLAMLLLPAFVLVACGDDDDNGASPDPDYSYVRVAHLSPNAPAVDVWLDGEIVLEDVTFEGFSEYLEVETGDRMIQVTPADEETPVVIDAMVTLETDEYYTVAATGLLEGSGMEAINATVLVDDRSVDAEQAKVRFVHAGPDAPAVDILTAGSDTPLFDNIAFRESGDYAAVPGGAYTLIVRTDAGEEEVIRFAPLALEAGKNYTVFAKGLLDAGTMGNELGALASVDAPGSGSAVIDLEAAETPMSYLRVGHLSPDAPDVDVYVNGTLTLEEVPYRAFSGYLSVPAGGVDVEITPAGDAGTTVIEESITLSADTYYTVTATGLLDDNSLTATLYMDEVMTDAEQAKVRFVHASPDAPEVNLALRDGDDLWSGVEFREDGGYIMVAGGTYDFDVNVSSSGAPALFVDDVELSGSTNYTVFAVGLAGGGDAPLDAIAVLDDPGMGNTVVDLNTSAPQYAQLRVAHLSPDAPNVDVYVAGNMVLENVPYTAVSAYLEVLADRETSVQVFATGTSEDPVIDASLTFEPDAAYTVAATGSLDGGSFGPNVIMDDLAIDEENARVRFLHASPDAPAVDITLADGSILFDDYAFNATGGFATVGSGSYDLQVRPADGSDIVTGFPDVGLEAGTVYTVAATGFLGDGTLGAIAVVDAPGDGSTTVVLEQEMPSTSVRVAHLSPGAPAVDVWVNGNVVNDLTNVPFEVVSDYLMLDAGATNVQVFAAGTSSDPVIDTDLFLDADNYTTIAATGPDASDIGAQVLMDDVMPGADAKVRFFHASPDAPEVDITLDDSTVLFDDVEFNEAQGYIEVGGGSYNLQVRPSADDETVVLSFGDVALSGGMNYTVVAKGNLGDGSLSAFAIVDDMDGGGSTVELMTGEAELRAAHLVPDGPNVDVYLNGEIVSDLTNVPYEAVSGYLMVPAKTHQVQVFVTGTNTDPIVEEMVTLTHNDAFTFAVTGLVAGGDIEAMALTDSRTGGAQAMVRFVHAGPDAPAVDVQVAGGDPVLFNNVAFREYQGYIDVAGGSYDLEVALESDGTVVLELDDVMFENGENVTIFAIGLVSDGSLTALPVVDTP
ncbi:DUF4397 domain-containing protein [bacterium]|nr:DUF4397 domain-containing protein [bacterium]